MNKNYDHICFDLDGTLCDSTQGINQGVLFALKKMGIKENEDGIKKIIGLPLHVSLRKFYFKNNKDTWKAVEAFRNYYSAKGLYESNLYYGIKSLLRNLSKISNLHMVTAKPTPYAIEVAKYHQILKYFKSIHGCQLSGGDFSKGDEIKKILLKEKTAKAIMIGDRAVDISAGKENKIDTVGILYGYGQTEELLEAAPTYFAQNVRELKKILM